MFRGLSVVLSTGLVLAASTQSGCRSGFEANDVADAAAVDSAPSADAAVALQCGSRAALPIPETGLVAGTTTGEANEFFGSCGGADSPETIYKVDVASPATGLFIEAPSPPASFSPVVYVRSNCDETNAELSCGTEGSGPGPRALLRNLDPGPYVVFVDGADDSGLFELRVTQLDGEGATCAEDTPGRRCDSELDCIGTCKVATCEGAIEQTDAFTVTGSTADGSKVHAGSCGRFGGFDAPEVVFAVTLTEDVANLRATTDQPGTNYDTLIYLRAACTGSEIACNDDQVDQRSEINSGPLEAGTYFLVVDGFSSDRGDFELEVSLTPVI